METSEDDTEEGTPVRYFFKTPEGVYPLWAYGGVLVAIGWEVTKDGVPIMERTLH